MKPLFGLILTLLVVSLCEAIPAEAGEQPLKPGQSSFKDCANDCPGMVVIPAGSFTMGSPEAEPGRQLTEAPQHNVTIGKPFAVYGTPAGLMVTASCTSTTAAGAAVVNR